MKKNNKGFTMLEVLISVSLLSIFLLLIATILTMTSNISQKFLDYSDYEYAMMHKKIFQLYDDSRKVTISKNKLIFENDKENREHNIVFNSKKVYKQTKNPGEGFASGYSLLLDNIESFLLERVDNEVIIKIVDRSGKNRSIKLFLKDEIKEEREKEEKKKRDRELEEKELADDKENKRKYEEEYQRLLSEEENYRKHRIEEARKILVQSEKEDRGYDSRILEEKER